MLFMMVEPILHIFDVMKEVEGLFLMIRMLEARQEALEKIILSAHPELRAEYLQDKQHRIEELAKAYPELADLLPPSVPKEQ